MDLDDEDVQQPASLKKPRVMMVSDSEEDAQQTAAKRTAEQYIEPLTTRSKAKRKMSDGEDLPHINPGKICALCRTLLPR